MSASEEIRARIKREGPIPFDTYVELALYGEHGFFTAGRGAGRAGGDFITSPEVGSLFGALTARALDEFWVRLDRPDPFLVVEAGAGSGRLAREVLRAEPECLPALRYVLVERSADLRASQRELLEIEPADEALGAFAAARGDDPPVPTPESGPVFTALEHLPALSFDGVVVANELLDNLPFGVAHRSGDRWDEVRVAIDGNGFREVLVPAIELDDLPDDAAEGTRYPIPRGAREWLRAAGQIVRHGNVLLVDYMTDAPGPEWLRTYRAHDRGDDPLVDPGSQDITADVVVGQLMNAAHAAGFDLESMGSQADWLGELGIEELVAEGERTWRAGAHRGDLDALAGRSRGNEAAALTDPEGLGNHQVVVLTKRAPG